MKVQNRPRRKRVLFVGEAVTLAHVVRPLALAEALDPAKYEVFFACDPCCRHLVRSKHVRYIPIQSIPSETFQRRVYQTCPLYREEELRKYVRDDLRVISAVRPDVIVSDFRVSLGISAELCGIPHLALSNAHWCPGANLPCPVPDNHPMVKLFGVKLMSLMLKATLPLFFKIQVIGFNRLCRAYGLKACRNAQEMFTRGTRTLYLDVPELYEGVRLPANHAYIGPAHWSPSDARLPEWWDDMPLDRPVAFVTPGSSGDADSALRIIRTLASMDVTVMVATAGRMNMAALPATVYAANFIPGLAAAARSAVVICNGGSGMVYQALSKGVPVVGIPSNIDQHYIMQALESKGAGRMIRMNELSEETMRAAVADMLGDGAVRDAAVRMKACLAEFVAAEELASVIDEFGAPAEDDNSVEISSELCNLNATRVNAAGQMEPGSGNERILSRINVFS